MIVTRFGSTLMCFSKIGSVHRATAPKPTNKIRFENVSIHHLYHHDQKTWRTKNKAHQPTCVSPTTRQAPADCLISDTLFQGYDGNVKLCCDCIRIEGSRDH